MGECWGSGTSTFLMMGSICTRGCRFCDVKHGRPEELDWDEPERVAQAVKTMDLRHAVITSVNRDEREDGGAPIFAMVIQRIRELQPGCSVEVLIPDFQRFDRSPKNRDGRPSGDPEPQPGNRAPAFQVSPAAVSPGMEPGHTGQRQKTGSGKH